MIKVSVENGHLVRWERKIAKCEKALKARGDVILREFMLEFHLSHKEVGEIVDRIPKARILKPLKREFIIYRERWKEAK